MLRRRGSALGILLAACIALFGLGAPAAPKRVVSTNLCADQLTLRLADRSQIVSLSETAFEAPLSNVAREAAGLGRNHQRLEEIVAQRPDLVITSDELEGPLNHMLSRLRIPFYALPTPRSLAEARTAILGLAQALGHGGRGQRMVETMTSRINALRVRPQAFPGPPLGALVYEANGGTVGTRTLDSEIMSLAGFKNLAGQYGITNWGNLNLEQMVAANPDIIVFETDGQQGVSLSQLAMKHPVLKALVARRASVEIPARLWVCPGPWNVEALARLVTARGRIGQRVSPPPHRAP